MERHTIPLPPQPLTLELAVSTFKALADPVRLQLILQLRNRRECSVGELVDALALPQSTVSRHLAVLRHSHLVLTRRDSTIVHYRLADPHVGDLVIQAFSHADHQGSDAHSSGTAGVQDGAPSAGSSST